MSVKNCIQEIVEVKKKHNLTPEQSRYVDKQVRLLLGLKTIVRSKKLPTYLTASEIYNFLENANTISSKHRLLCEVLIFTGMRINELRNLDIRDIQFDNNQIFVREGKGKKDRYVPISNNLLHKIKLFTEGRNKGSLFLNRSKTQYSKRMLQTMVEDVIKATGLQKHMSTHSLRHTFACLCLAKGIKIEEIKLLMGHSAIKTTEVYARLELGDIKQKYLQLMGDS